MIFEKLNSISKETFYKILTLILSSILFTNILPILMFIIYMKESMFFSYDFFLNGLFGLNIFFFFIVITIIVYSIFITSSLFFITEIFIKKKKLKIGIFPFLKNEYKEKLIILLTTLFMNGLLIFLLILNLLDKNELLSYFIYINIICVILTIHFANVFYAKAQYGFKSLLVSFSLIIFVAIFNIEKTADLVKYGLEKFGSAGKEVKLININNSNVFYKGQVLLLSPQNIFITNKDTNKTILTIIKRDNIIIEMVTKNTKPNESLEEEQVTPEISKPQKIQK